MENMDEFNHNNNDGNNTKTMSNDKNNSCNNIDNIDPPGTSNSVAKGKRTRRQRPAVASSSGPALSTSSTSAESTCTTTEEEEDMANCLILLAQGRGLDSHFEDPKATPSVEKFTSRRFTEAVAATADSGKAGYFVYECKTCNKCFPSFQALGGHRTSHKKPKIALGASTIIVDQENLQISKNSFAKNNLSSNKSRVHVCSICASEFSSGQALGGHMRRHRQLNVVAESSEDKRDATSVLLLDLNLPAPAEDDSKGEFSKSPVASETLTSVAFPVPLHFSTSALIDCHY